MASRVSIVRGQFVKLMSQGIKINCGICNNPIEYTWELTVDHVQPKSRGGSNRVDNLQPAHMTCNQKKGNDV